LLLCHGFIGSLENFHSWVPAFAGRRRVLIPDLPGYGETPLGPPPYTVAGQAEFLSGFASQLGLGEHDLGGICLGATTALEYARRWPQAVSRLVLHTPIYSPLTLRRPFLWQVRVGTFTPLYAAVDRMRRVQLLSNLYKRFVVEGPGVDPYDAQVNFHNQIRADARAAREWLRDAVRRDYREFLRTWERPVLVLVAADDRIVNVRSIRELGDLMPQAELRVIESAGHGWTAALIAAQVQVIADFLGRP